MKPLRPQTRSLLLTAIYMLLTDSDWHDNNGGLLIQGGEAFRSNSSPRHKCRSTFLYSSNSNINSRDGDNSVGNNGGTDMGNYWRLPNDFSLFLTQRSIQSFMFLTSQLRDPETCYWVENFTQPNLALLRDSSSNSSNNKPKFSLTDTIPKNDGDNGAAGNDWKPAVDDGKTNHKKNESEEEERRTCHLLRYHGLAAMDSIRFPNWESYFEELLEQPTDEWIIASEQSHIPNYTWEIDPSSICSRILSVREQLSREFVKDLQVVSDMGGRTFDWNWDRLKQSRDDEQEQQQSNNNNMPFIDPSSLKGSRENLLFLEISVDDPLSDHKPSPLRRGNFDLLVLLATEEAIHRVLNKWEANKSNRELYGSELASHGFLEQFYQDRQHFFHGPLPQYGKADDILEELLSSALSFKADCDDSSDSAAFSSSVINPTKIAELVLREREQVALEWKQIAMEAPQHHMKIQKLRLDRMMMGNKNQAEGTTESSAGDGIFE